MPQASLARPPALAKTSEGKARDIERLIAPAVAAMGYEIVRVRFANERRGSLQVMIERSDRSAMTVDDCAQVSRSIAAILDVEDPIAGAYQLEVSSPGIDRPLTRLADFDRFAGYEAKVETVSAVDGRRRFRGRLLGVDGETVRLRLDDGSDVVFAFADLAKAKLVLTDDLIAASQADG